MPSRLQQIANYWPLHLLLIWLVTAAAFWPSLSNGFVNWDDPAYLEQSALAQDLTPARFQEIFTSYVNSNYQPLSVLSFVLEYRYAGINPGLYHAGNLALHLCNSALVYCLIFLLTRRRPAALIAALLFGIHPMHVESVAWVTERKDVLFGLFYLLSLIAYAGYVKSNTHQRWYWFAALATFLFSVLAKPTAVTLPAALLLIDFLLERPINIKLFLEKIPMIAVSIIFCIIAIVGAATPDVDVYPMGLAFSQMFHQEAALSHGMYSLGERLLFVSYVLLSYLAKLFWPVGLSAFYPYPSNSIGKLPAIVYFSPVFLGIVLAVAGRLWSYSRTFIFGVLFFIITIAPNLPIKEFGHLAVMADRFTYIPYIGLFLLMAVTFDSFLLRGKVNMLRFLVFACVVTVMVSALCFQTMRRCLIWKDSGALWSDVLEKYPRHPTALYNRGNYFVEEGDLPRALDDYNGALKADPGFYRLYVNRGKVYGMLQQYDLEIEDYTKAIKINPRGLNAFLNRAAAYIDTGEFQKAIQDCNSALAIDPHNKIALQRKIEAEQRLDNSPGQK